MLLGVFSPAGYIERWKRNYTWFTWCSIMYSVLHYRSHMGKNLLCPICPNKAFHRMDHLKKHLRTHETWENDTSCMCSVCGKVSDEIWYSLYGLFTLHRTRTWAGRIWDNRSGSCPLSSVPALVFQVVDSHVWNRSSCLPLYRNDVSEVLKLLCL